MHARWTVLIALLLLPLAAAQPGPAPGYESALDYADDYAQEKAGAAASDPEGFVGQHGSPEGLQNETSHSIWLACWAADDAGVEAEPCDAYYTPRGEENPEQECECAPENETEEFTAAVENGTTSLQNATETFVNDTAADPANATEHGETFVKKALGAVTSVGGAAVDFVKAIVKGAAACLGITLAAGAAAGSAIGQVASLLVDTAAMGTASLGDVATSAGSATSQGAQAAAEGLVTAVQAIGSGIATAASSIGQGLMDAAKATGRGVAAVGGAIADAAGAIKDAVTGLFDGAGPSDGTGAPGPVDVDDTTDGLLDGVDSLLERV